MEYEGFKLKGVIFDNKYRLERVNFSFRSKDGSNYRFIIHDVGYNALTIVGFFKYSDIIHSTGKIENQLHEIIANRATSSHSLAKVADERKFYIYNEKVYVNGDFGCICLGYDCMRHRRNFYRRKISEFYFNYERWQY